jgi:hypothetical protein
MNHTFISQIKIKLKKTSSAALVVFSRNTQLYVDDSSILSVTIYQSLYRDYSATALLLCHSTTASYTDSVQLSNTHTKIIILLCMESLTCNMHVYYTQIAPHPTTLSTKMQSFTLRIPIKNHNHLHINTDYRDLCVGTGNKIQKIPHCHFTNCDTWFQVVLTWVKIGDFGSNRHSVSGSMLEITSENSFYWLVACFLVTFIHYLLCILIIIMLPCFVKQRVLQALIRINSSHSFPDLWFIVRCLSCQLHCTALTFVKYVSCLQDTAHQDSTISGFRRDVDEICANLRYRVLACFLSFFLSFLPSYSDSWPVKMEPIRCPKTSVNNYHTPPRNIPEERRSH